MKLLFNLASCLSRTLNTLRGGTPEMTLSAAAYAEDLKIRPFIDKMFSLFGQEDHCWKSFRRDVEEARRVVNELSVLLVDRESSRE